MKLVLINISQLSSTSLNSNPVDEVEVNDHSFEEKFPIEKSTIPRLTMETPSGTLAVYGKSIATAVAQKTTGTGRNAKTEWVNILEYHDGNFKLPITAYSVSSVGTGETNENGKERCIVHFHTDVEAFAPPAAE
jgi:hypothetical protein